MGILAEMLKNLNLHFGLCRMALSQPRSQVGVKVRVDVLTLCSGVLLSSCTLGSLVLTSQFLLAPGTLLPPACNYGDFAYL